MRFRRWRWQAAGLVAFLMGIPLAERAAAQDVTEIITASMGLAGAIADFAGSS